jgi:hypothetical protein
MAGGHQADAEDGDDELVLQAVKEGCVAGACWTAARLDRRSAAIWRTIAERHHQGAGQTLSLICARAAATRRTD